MKQQALDFLEKSKEVALATTDGVKPAIRIFQIMHREGDIFYFATAVHKDVYRQLQVNPNIEIMAFNDNIFSRLAGKAVFDVPDALQQQIYNDNPVLPRLYKDYQALVYFRLEPEEMSYYDLTPTPPTNYSYKFNN